MTKTEAINRLEELARVEHDYTAKTESAQTVLINALSELAEQAPSAYAVWRMAEQELQKLQAEYQSAKEIAEANAKAAVLSVGETTPGGGYLAVFNSGRTSWDTKKLEGLAILVPQILQAQKMGEPYITLRKDKKV